MTIAEKCLTIIDCLPVQVVELDLKLRIKYMNAEFLRMFPLAEIGVPLGTVCGVELSDPDMPLLRARDSGNEEIGRIQLFSNGVLFHFDARVVPLFDKRRRMTSLVCICNDITRLVMMEKETEKQRERYQNFMSIQDSSVDRLIHMQRELTNQSRELERKNRELQQMTMTDPLTGLYNRRAFDENFSREIRRAERYEHPLSVIFADIDNFRDFNNNFDYDTGDAVLRAIADAMRSIFRDTDIITRYGGEEFVVILPETDFTVVHRIAERLRQSIEITKVNSRHGQLSVTVSVGTATVCRQAIDHSKFLNVAVDALHEAKRGGRDRTVSRQVEDNR